MRRTAIAILVVASLFAGCAVQGADQYVWCGYAGGDSDGTIAKPWTNIQAGISNAGSSNYVRVAEGIYPGGLIISNGVDALGGGVKVFGGYSTNFGERDFYTRATVISNGAGDGFSMSASAHGFYLSGVTIVGCSGRGVSIGNAPKKYTIEDCAFSGNGSDGIYENDSNTAGSYIRRCLFVGNKSYAINMFGNSYTIINCTIVSNKYGVYANGYTSATLRNNIIASSTNSVGLSGAGICASSCNCIYGNAGGMYGGVVFDKMGDISSAPLFAGGGDYHLKSVGGRYLGGTFTNDTATSPCVDAGKQTDSVGLEPSPNGGIINMGIYGGTVQASKSPPQPSVTITAAYVRNNKVAVLFSGTDDLNPNTNIVFVAANCEYALADGATTNWSDLTFVTNDPDHTADEPMRFPSNYVAIIDSTGWLSGSNYQVRLQVNDDGGTGYDSAQATSATFLFSVPCRVKNISQGFSYALPINTVISMASAGNTIGLSSGVFAEAVSVDRAVTLQGGYNADFSAQDYTNWITTVVSNSAGVGVTFKSTISGTVAVRGITAAGCGSHGFYGENAGFTLLLQYCVSRGNAGAGVYPNNNNIRVYMTNCLVADNGDYGFYGGGYAAVIENCTFANNNGGVHSLVSANTLYLKNCIVSLNSSNRAALECETVCTWDSSYNDLYNAGTGGVYRGTGTGTITNKTGDISLDPLFVGGGDYHERSKGGTWNESGWTTYGQHSPCIDKGNPASSYTNEPAPNGRRINMGAYGNTLQASMFPFPKGTIFTIR